MQMYEGIFEIKGDNSCVDLQGLLVPLIIKNRY